MNTLGNFYCFGCILVNVLARIAAHQFDVDNAILYEDPTPVTENSRENYFGYSVALWNEDSKAWIFIGAPRANSSLYEGTTETGTVFRCPIGQKCTEWPIDKHLEKIQQRQNGSWLGGTMIVQNSNPPKLWVCAPRWMDYLDPNKTMVPVYGKCYKASVEDVNKNEPQGKNINLLEPPRDYHRIGNQNYPLHVLGQCGFSLHVTQDESRHKLVSGCPGVWNSHGISIIEEDYYESSFIVLNAVDDLGSNSDQFGYAVTSGIYFDDAEHIDVRGGPRGNKLLGEVRLFQFPSNTGESEAVKSLLNLNGEQIGEHFGATLASCDIDGDSKHDILVGAPLWSKNIEELGRIYIYRQGYGRCYQKIKSCGFKKLEHIAGKISGGRFGAAITCLGDINYDGFADVAVGAPYDGNGAVDIYYGSKNGLDLDNRRRISGPENTKGFGFLISEAVDIDDNGYVDIAIGAYLSGHVMLVRSNSVVNLTVKLSSNLTSNSGLRRNAGFLSLKVCSVYEGVNAPPNIIVTTELKIDDEGQRAIFFDKEIDDLSKTIYTFNTTLNAAQEWCHNYTVKIKKLVERFPDPLKFSVRQNLPKHGSKTGLLKVNGISKDSDNFCKSCAVLNELRPPPEDHLEVAFALECNDTIECLSILSINMTTNWSDGKPYVIGSSEFIELDVTVRNDGQMAFYTKVKISMPSYIELHNSASLTYDEVETVGEIRTVTFIISNFLDQNETESMKVYLNASTLRTDFDMITLNATAVTSSNDTGSGNYIADLSIRYVVQAAIGIAGASEEALYPYTLSGPAEELPNIRFRHTFGLRNDEITPISLALLSVSIPTHWIVSSDKEVEIVRLNEMMGGISKPGEDIDSKILRQDTNEPLSSDATTMSNWLPNKDSSKTKNHFINFNGKVLAASAENRTLYMNCTNPAFKCTTVSFKFGPLELKRTTAALDLVLEMLFSNIKPDIIGIKDIILFVTNASTKILTPQTQLIANMNPVSMMVGTQFVGSPQDQHVAMWVIVTSSSVGLLLLLLIVLALVKLGFFTRTKKVELEALKQQNGACPKLVLETTSSTEALDQPYYIKETKKKEGNFLDSYTGIIP
nr:integrin alpha-9-like isoform X1 [Neodiprion pinetum]